ncbi:hypothetical protein P278_04790 [Zhouia amylolytica AD3]|uniref:Uncharacterized protein n=1 Tax=Zhouia amylolytica AD3 TaxID=1286632 RepID=W2USR5_9FLAO|nr:hypothetical protein P278_04790 [Zhouia amylolytica AD3]
MITADDSFSKAMISCIFSKIIKTFRSFSHKKSAKLTFGALGLFGN